MSIMYPYPSHVCAPSFVTVKLGGKDMYSVWKAQMECLLVSHDMLGFTDGTLGNPRKCVLGKGIKEDYMSWVRSDALVKGWILGSLSKRALRHVVKDINEDFSAKDAWDKVHKMYGPPRIHQHGATITLATDVDDKKDMKTREVESSTRNLICEEPVSKNEEENKEKNAELEKKKREESIKRKEKEQIQEKLYKSILDQDDEWFWVKVNDARVQLTDIITDNGNTTLHVASSTTNNNKYYAKYLTQLLEEGVKDMSQLNLRNADGSTPLHVAAIVGNTEAAKILVSKNKDLLLAKDNEGQIPLSRALSNMHFDTYLYLLEKTKSSDPEMSILTTGADDLVANAISSKDFESARRLFHIFKPNNSDIVLMAMAQNFPSKPNIWERMAYKISHHRAIARVCDLLQIKPDLFSYEDWHILEKDLRRSWIYPLFADVWPFKFLLKKCDLYFSADNLLRDICNKSGQYHSIRNPIFEATRQNADRVVKIIAYYFPSKIWIENEDGHNIIQYAVINRSEKVYNLLYQMSEQKNIYRTIKDSSGNNLLHLAARLAPPNHLNLISGAALQIQHELQWFEEVKRFVCPLNVIQKNFFEETPDMVFTREHKDLVIEGEKWMKGTAESYTITAALVATIMFAAAITVPGGNNQDSGIPIFSSKIAFKIFAISVVISLLSSVTSLVMFLSILTARFAEQDFLYKLPTKLIIGLVTLFISTTSMIIAFGATVFLVFGTSGSSILVHIAIWSCLPIASFVKFHFPLVVDLISATYGPSIFGKKTYVL